MDLGLENKICVVTGASKGIGRAIAVAFAQEGVSLSVCARDGIRAESVAKEVRGHGGRAIAIACDVSREDDVNRLVEETLKEYGRIDILVANAAVIEPVKFAIEMPVADWRKHLDINLTGVFLCNRAVLPHMIRQNYGRIQNMGSGLESEPAVRLGAYAASKGAVNSMTRVLAMETATYDIKVNVHYPGNLRTDDKSEVCGVLAILRVVDDCLCDKRWPAELVGAGEQIEGVQPVTVVRPAIPVFLFALGSQKDRPGRAIDDRGAGDADFAGEIAVVAAVIGSRNWRSAGFVEVDRP